MEISTNQRFVTIFVSFIITNLIVDRFHWAFWPRTVVGAVIIMALISVGLKAAANSNSKKGEK